MSVSAGWCWILDSFFLVTYCQEFPGQIIKVQLTDLEPTDSVAFVEFVFNTLTLAYCWGLVVSIHQLFHIGKVIMSKTSVCLLFLS